MLPIPAGMHWSEQMPVMVSDTPERQPAPRRAAKKKKAVAVQPPVKKIARFGNPDAVISVKETPSTPAPPAVPAVKEKHETPKCDPRLVSAARELRDRWLEQVNAESLLPAGKYDVTRQITGTARASLRLDAA